MPRPSASVSMGPIVKMAMVAPVPRAAQPSVRFQFAGGSSRIASRTRPSRRSHSQAITMPPTATATTVEATRAEPMSVTSGCAPGFSIACITLSTR